MVLVERAEPNMEGYHCKSQLLYSAGFGVNDVGKYTRINTVDVIPLS